MKRIHYFLQRTKSFTDETMYWCPPFFLRVKLGIRFFYYCYSLWESEEVYWSQELTLHISLCISYEIISFLGCFINLTCQKLVKAKLSFVILCVLYNNLTMGNSHLFFWVYRTLNVITEQTQCFTWTKLFSHGEGLILDN